MGLNSHPGVCVDCDARVSAGHGRLTRSPSGAWIVTCGKAKPASKVPATQDPGVRLAACEAARLKAEDEVKALRVDFEIVRKERYAFESRALKAEAEVKALRAQAPGHNLTDDVVKATAQDAGRAVVDAVLKTLSNLRAKPSAEEEEARIARSLPLPDGAPLPRARRLDTDDDASTGPTMREAFDAAKPIAQPTGDSSDAAHEDADVKGESETVSAPAPALNTTGAASIMARLRAAKKGAK